MSSQAHSGVSQGPHATWQKNHCDAKGAGETHCFSGQVQQKCAKHKTMFFSLINCFWKTTSFYLKMAFMLKYHSMSFVMIQKKKR